MFQESTRAGGGEADRQVCACTSVQSHYSVSRSSVDIFVYSTCRYAVCIILNLERTLHPLTGVFPAGKKNERNGKKETSFTFWNKKIKTPTAHAKCQAFTGQGRPRLRSGHAPRSRALLDGFLINTVGSSGNGSFGKKDVLERNMGLQPRHISSYKTENMHVSRCKEPSLSQGGGVLLLHIPGEGGGSEPAAL